QQHRQVLVPGRVLVGPHEQQAAVGLPREARPDLASGDSVTAFDTTGRALDVGQVGTGLWFGEALAPDGVAGEDAREVCPPLFLCAVSDQGRRGENLADAAEPVGGMRAGCKFVEGHFLGQAEAAAAVFDGKGQARVSTFVQPALPVMAYFRRLFLTERPAVLPPSRGNVFRQPGGRLFAERLQVRPRAGCLSCHVAPLMSYIPNGCLRKLRACDMLRQ